MLSKKISSILLAASLLTPTAAAIVEEFDSECVEAATQFVDTSSLTKPKTCACLYAMPPYLSRLKSLI